MQKMQAFFVLLLVFFSPVEASALNPSTVVIVGKEVYEFFKKQKEPKEAKILKAKHGNEEALKDVYDWANQGDNISQYTLGEIFEAKNNIHEAVRWYWKSAKNGSRQSFENIKRLAIEQENTECQNLMGEFFLNGEFVKESPEDAVQWFKKAAEKGNSESQFYLGQLFFQGKGTTPCHEEAMKWYKKAAENGHVEAQYNWAIGQLSGNVTNENEVEAINYLFKVAKQNHIGARQQIERLAENGNLECKLFLGNLLCEDPATRSIGINYLRRAAKDGSRQAIKEIIKLAITGNKECQNELVMLFNHGKLLEEDIPDSCKIIEKLAKEGNEDAKLIWAKLLETGIGADPQKEAAIILYKELALKGNLEAIAKIEELGENGDLLAQGFLGDFYSPHERAAIKLNKKNLEKSIYWYKKAFEKQPSKVIDNLRKLAQHDNIECQSLLAEFYQRAHEDKHARYWFERLAVKGDQYAKEQVKKYERLAQYFSELRAKAEKEKISDPEILRELGICYLYGTGGQEEPDLKTAAFWFSQAAEQGDNDSTLHLASIYRHGKPQDKKAALQLLFDAGTNGDKKSFAQIEKFAKSGDPEAKSKFDELQTHISNLIEGKNGELNSADHKTLGYVYWFGICGQKRDDAKATVHFIAAANAGDEKAKKIIEEIANLGDSKCQRWLGNFFFEGRVFEKNLEKSVFWYKKAAEQGDELAQQYLALAYLKGQGVEKDAEKAKSWLEKAAKQGLESSKNKIEGLAHEGQPEFQRLMGNLLYEGEIYEKDLKKAVFWYKKAAGKKDALSQYYLGLAYLDGEGIEQSLEEAMVWLKESAINGNLKAQKKLEEIKKKYFD